MTTRVQEKTCLRETIGAKEPRMRMLEKCMLRCAVFDLTDRVLDANVCNGQVAEYLLRNMDCEVCGVSDRMEEIRRTRARMNGGDFVYAAIGDIPWQDETFDTVLLHPTEGGLEALRQQLDECSRVLKPGGQLVLGLRCLPAAFGKIGQFLMESSPEEGSQPTVQSARNAMQDSGFGHITRVNAGLCGFVLIGWKAGEALAEDELQ